MSSMEKVFSPENLSELMQTAQKAFIESMNKSRQNMQASMQKTNISMQKNSAIMRKKFFDSLSGGAKFTEKSGIRSLLTSINKSLPKPGKTEPLKLSKKDAGIIYLFGLLSDIVYDNKYLREMPKEAGPIIMEYEEVKPGVIPFMINADNDMNAILVTCRGTYSIPDFITDLNVTPAKYEEGLVHSGILAAAKSTLSKSRSVLQELLKEPKNKEIIFIGHSLGAGAATICTDMLLREDKDLPVKCYAYAPPAMLTKNLLERTQKHTKAFVMGGDPIPFLSLSNVLKVIEPFMPTQAKESFRKTLGDDILYPPGDLYHIDLLSIDQLKVSISKIKDLGYFDSFHNQQNEGHHSMYLYRQALKTYYNSL